MIGIHQRTDTWCFTLWDCNLYLQAVHRNKNPCTFLLRIKIHQVNERPPLPPKVSRTFYLRKRVSSIRATIRKAMLNVYLPQGQNSVFQFPYVGSAWAGLTRPAVLFAVVLLFIGWLWGHLYLGHLSSFLCPVLWLWPEVSLEHWQFSFKTLCHYHFLSLGGIIHFSH